jgi:predicted SAM-dependent methyltransferase
VNWRIKGIIQKSLDYLPRGDEVYRYVHGRFSGLRDPEFEMDGKVIGDWLVFASHLRSLGLDARGLNLMEIGTGWYPTLPVCFALIGAACTHTYDLTRHLDPKLVIRLVRRLERHLQAIAEASGQSIEEVRTCFAALSTAGSAGAILEGANIHYHAPGDATSSGLPDGSVDVVFSNSVLEHVLPEVIVPLMRESWRVLRPGGYAIHSVNCGDHYAYCDRTITQVNYLRYSDRYWSLWNNDRQYQNRLRAREFVDAARSVGFDIAFSYHRPRAELVEEVARMRLPDQFARFTIEELAVTSIDFAAHKPAAATGASRANA